MANKTIHQVDNFTSTLSLSDQLLIYDVSTDTTNRTTFQKVKDDLDLGSGGGSSIQNLRDSENGGALELNINSYSAIASGNNAIAIGSNVSAEGDDSFAQGLSTTATANRSHTEGYYTYASGANSHSEGYCTYTSGAYAHTEGYNWDENLTILDFNTYTTSPLDNSLKRKLSSFGAKGKATHSEGKLTTAQGDFNHAEGYWTTTTGSVVGSHVQGYGTMIKSNSTASHAEGQATTVSGGRACHTEGWNTQVLSPSSACHAEGFKTNASKFASHSQGYNTTASGSTASHAQGHGTKASGDFSHAEGTGTQASGQAAHAEGYGTTAAGAYSHAEGRNNIASANQGHVGGYGSTAQGVNNFVHGSYLVSTKDNQAVFGQYNVSTNSLFVVGNGSSTADRSNAFMVHSDGRVSAGAGAQNNEDLLRKDDVTYGNLAPSAITVSNNTYTTLIKHTFQANTCYIIYYNAGWSSSSTAGQRMLLISTNSEATGDIDRYSKVTAEGQGVNNSPLCGIRLLKTGTSNETYYIRFRQTSGSTMSVTPGLAWIKLN